MNSVISANTASFDAAVTQRIKSSFKETISRRSFLYCKALMFISWAALSYCALVFFTTTIFQAIVFAASLSVALIGIGFNIQHDGNHGSFSSRQWLNRLAGMTIDLMGGSSYFWKLMHNVSHHTYTNIDRLDNDVTIEFFARLCPSQQWRRHHQYQHLYMWVLYSLFYLRFTLGDFYKLASSRVANKIVPRPRGLDLVQFIGGKTLFYGWALVLPMFFHPWYAVVSVYLGAILFMGLVFAVVFSLAHAVDIVEHPSETPERSREAWMVHQVRTTANFATGNWFITFLLGGLNFQVVHHLFPQVCHTNYPAIALAVRQVCQKYDVPYNEHTSLFQALCSHYRFLRMMGRPHQASAPS